MSSAQLHAPVADVHGLATAHSEVGAHGLATVHTVVAAYAALHALGALLMIPVGIAASLSMPAQERLRFIALNLGVALCVFMAIVTYAGLTYHAGHCLRRGVNLKLVRQLSWLQLPLFPFGTALAVCTLLKLRNPQVQAAFR